MSRFFVVILICVLGGVVYGQTESIMTIEYTDPNGNLRQVPVRDTGKIVIFRQDGSAAVDILYDRGYLQTAATRRLDGSVEVHAVYDRGDLKSVATHRGDGSAEAHIVYEDERLENLTSFRRDGDLEAIIGYEGGAIEHLAIADPDKEQIYNNAMRLIEFTPAAQVLVQDGIPVCER